MTMNENILNAVEKLETLEDVKLIVREALKDIFGDGEHADMSGRVCNLLQVWMRANETSKVDDLEKRIKALEHEKSLDKIRIEV